MNEGPSLVEAIAKDKLLVSADEKDAYLVKRAIIGITVTIYKIEKNPNGSLDLFRSEVKCFERLNQVAQFLDNVGDLYLKDYKV